MAAFVPPTFTPPAAFTPPDPNELAANPSYQFRLNQGNDLINKSAAAKGLLRSGGTLKDILQYGQNFASQEYDQAYDRAFNQYGQQRDAAFREYDIQRQNALDKWKADWDMHVFNNTPRGGGGRHYEDLPPPPEAPGGDPYGDPGYDPGGDPGGDPYPGNPYTPQDPYGQYY